MAERACTNCAGDGNYHHRRASELLAVVDDALELLTDDKIESIIRANPRDLDTAAAMLQVKIAAAQVHATLAAVEEPL